MTGIWRARDVDGLEKVKVVTVVSFEQLTVTVSPVSWKVVTLACVFCIETLAYVVLKPGAL